MGPDGAQAHARDATRIKFKKFMYVKIRGVRAVQPICGTGWYHPRGGGREAGARDRAPNAHHAAGTLGNEPLLNPRAGYGELRPSRFHPANDAQHVDQ